MNTSSCPLGYASGPRALRSLVFLLVLAPLTLLSIPATPALPSDTPPIFADAVHVREGCFISSLAYLARFSAAYPEERGMTLRVDVPAFKGSHTVALISWRGEWWVRDEYCGVFSLDRTVDTTSDVEALRERATDCLRRIAGHKLRAGTLEGANATTIGPMERARDVSRAASLLPCASTTFWVTCDGRELPFLFFVPKPGMIAVYDPASGTATAECTATDAPALVKIVATRLGYAPSTVRAEARTAIVTVAALIR